MDKLTRVKLSGFKSIREMDLELRPLNVLIGANGSGKSNLISYLKMHNFAMTGGLQRFIGTSGGADALLHYGAKTTPQIEGKFVFETQAGTNTYAMRLMHAAQDTLIYADETVCFQRGRAQSAEPRSLGAGHRETALIGAARDGDKTAEVELYVMSRWSVFQFHDTSETANIRLSAYISDNRYLRSDAGNLAAYLYGLRETNREYYDRIVATLRQIAPFFGDFVLEPRELDNTRILLNWRERDREMVFGPHQLSDGTLRSMALLTLLLQPEEKLPSVLIIDEPELGLHPYAIEVLASLLRSVSNQAQVIVATQSVGLVDHFEPEDIVVVDRKEGASVFSRPNEAGLREWLEDYSLSELWEKNLIGGTPSR